MDETPVNIAALAGFPRRFVQKTWQRLFIDEAVDLPQWQERILVAVFAAVMLFGLVPLYTSLKMAIAAGLWLNAAIYLGGYLLGCGVAFVRAIPLVVRAWVVVGMLFLLGALAFFTLGPHGSGRIYIFAAAIMASLLLGLRASLSFLAFVIAFCAVFTYLLNTGDIRWTLADQDPINSWNAAIVTFLFLCVLTCVALAVLIKGLAAALDKTRNYSRQLSDVGDALRGEVKQQEQLQVGLRASEKRFKDLFESAPNAYFSLEMNGRIIRCNKQAAMLLGCPSQDLRGRSIMEFFPDNTPGKTRADAVLARFRRGGEVIHEELRMRKADGELIWVEFTLNAVQEVSGGFTEGRAIVVDVTERKRIAQALAESEQRFRQIFEESPVPLFMQDFSGVKTGLQALACSGVGDLKQHLEHDPEELGNLLAKIKFVFINQATLDLYETDNQDDAAAMLAGLASEEAGRYYIDLLADLFQGKTRFERTRHRLTHQGNEIDIIVSKVVMAGYEEDLSRVLTSIIDISAISKAQREKELLETQLRQSQKMEAIGTLAGGIAHDFNNLLGVMTGYAELALGSVKAKRCSTKEIEEILTAGERARELIQRILTFSRKVEVDLEPLDLNAEVGRTAQLLGRTLPKMISIETVLAADLPLVKANANQLQQIVLNLATNAQHAMPEGGRLAIETQAVTLDREYCSRHLESAPGRYVVLQVSDTGCGMDDETREHIFDPFFTTKGIGEGTGLGLSSIFGIVKGFGGQILCYSEPGTGTTFKIYLPALEPDAALPRGKASSTAETVGGSETIVLVDDNEDLCSIGSQFLADSGYRVLTANSGEQAVGLYRDQGGDIDLVVMDLSMPGMGGYKALKAILEIDPRAKIIISSGYAINGSVKECLQAGAAGYVAKPFRKDELVALVRRVLDRAQ